jgi:signal transduction histidine kinase
MLDLIKDIERKYEHIDKNKLSILFSPEPPADNY